MKTFILGTYLIINISILIGFHILLFKVVKEKKEKDESYFNYLLRNSGVFFYFSLSIVLSLFPIVPLIFFIDALKTLKKENEKKKETKRNSIFSYENRYREWNDIYKCRKCSMYSRHYQLTEDSILRASNVCPFCKGTYTLNKVEDSEIYSIEDIPFCEFIKEEDKESHIFSIYDKWSELERKQKEFQKMKASTEIKIEQLKSYEKLKEADLSEKLSTYEQKLQENLKEMEDFKDSLLKEFNMQ